jgi:hypothetical protein
MRKEPLPPPLPAAAAGVVLQRGAAPRSSSAAAPRSSSAAVQRSSSATAPRSGYAAVPRSCSAAAPRSSSAAELERGAATPLAWSAAAGRFHFHPAQLAGGKRWVVPPFAAGMYVPTFEFGQRGWDSMSDADQLAIGAVEAPSAEAQAGVPLQPWQDPAVLQRARARVAAERKRLASAAATGRGLGATSSWGPAAGATDDSTSGPTAGAGATPPPLAAAIVAGTVETAANAKKSAAAGPDGSEHAATGPGQLIATFDGVADAVAGAAGGAAGPVVEGPAAVRAGAPPRAALPATAPAGRRADAPGGAPGLPGQGGPDKLAAAPALQPFDRAAARAGAPRRRAEPACVGARTRARPWRSDYWGPRRRRDG